jgi:transposase
MSQFYAGIDLAAKSSWLCVIDPEGNKLFSRRIPNDPAKIARQLQPYLPGLSAVVESTFNWYWMIDLLQDLEADVSLAHPLYLKAIAYAKVKTDQVDAHTLAQLLRMDYIPKAFIYPRELRPSRDMLRRRHRLVTLRAGFYRDLQLQLMKHNITGFGRNAIKQLDGRHLRSLLPHLHDRCAGSSLIHLIATLDKEIKQLDRHIRASVYHHRPVVLLKTIPGIGRTLAPTIYYEIGQIHRFPSDKAFASYCRLAPTIAQSGNTVRQGRNRKQGNRLLKWAFSEAAQMAIQRYPAISDYFNRLLKKKGKRILAKSIIAHKIAVAAFHVLKQDKPYQPGLLLPA